MDGNSVKDRSHIPGLYLSVGSRVKYPPIIEKDPTILEVTKKKKKKKKKNASLKCFFYSLMF